MGVRFLGAVGAHAKRVVRHLFQFEHGMEDLKVRRGAGSSATTWALFIPVALHTALAGNDVLALLGVLGIADGSHLAFELEVVFTAAVWLGHVLARSD